MAMSWSGKEICKFHMWTRRLTKTIPSAQSSSEPSFVEVMRLIRMESMKGGLATSKISLSLFSSLKVMLCWDEDVWNARLVVA